MLELQVCTAVFGYHIIVLICISLIVYDVEQFELLLPLFIISFENIHSGNHLPCWCWRSKPGRDLHILVTYFTVEIHSQPPFAHLDFGMLVFEHILSINCLSDEC